VKELIEANAAKLRELKATLNSTVGRRWKSDEEEQAWRNACARVHESYDALAFPGGYERALELLKQGDLATAEVAIIFCEMRPYFFRSGYNRSHLLRRLKHVQLPSHLAQRLQAILDEVQRRKVESRRRVNEYWSGRLTNPTDSTPKS
jgi:hypothetical protein